MTVTAPENFGDSLRAWRTRRSHSQLGLATEAGVSQRHISFLETGRSNPSREMVVHLGVVLDLPLRDRNAMLVSAGFAPVYAERSVDDPQLDDVRHALELMLAAHDPFPAYVLNHRWDLVMANESALRLITTFSADAQQHAGNLLRLTLHPDGIRDVVDNWEEAAAAVLRRWHRDLAESSSPDLDDLATEIAGYPDLPTSERIAAVPNAHDLLVPLTMTVAGTTLSLFTTMTKLASPVDITLEELRFETLLPANSQTEVALREFGRN